MGNSGFIATCLLFLTWVEGDVFGIAKNEVSAKVIPNKNETCSAITCWTNPGSTADEATPSLDADFDTRVLISARICIAP